ncbi:hypothetical protein KFK09_009003 [Dendrobium nobile]|uniref:Uncharacterized protein n=1 Tax=Dendrobium nobile TaxID=94219 RepID=A0A8T3BM91_DENNO|nr:hypothetical protein KFK09_009003 [Dendrobium nobile]
MGENSISSGSVSTSLEVKTIPSIISPNRFDILQENEEVNKPTDSLSCEEKTDAAFTASDEKFFGCSALELAFMIEVFELLYISGIKFFNLVNHSGMKFATIEVLSMRTVDLASALAQIIAETPFQLIKLQEDAGEIRGTKHQMWEMKYSNEKNELQVKKLMEENIESATQFLKLNKAFYILPIPFANTIFCSHNQSSDSYNLKPFEPQAPS